MKLNTVALIIGIISLLFICTQEKRHFSKQGNEIIEKGDSTFIIPIKYEKKGIVYKMFLRNETQNTISVVDRFSLQPFQQKIFEFKDTDSILFNNGPKIKFGEYGLETIDKKGELSGIGGEFWKKYSVPDDVEYGFVIVPPGEGDNPPN